MGQSKPCKPVAIVVEDDPDLRQLLAALLEEAEMAVVECASAEAAQRVIAEHGDAVSFVFTDVNLAGRMSGAELAGFVKRTRPDLRVVVTSGAHCPRLPEGARFMPKPWRALDVLLEAEKARR